MLSKASAWIDFATVNVSSPNTKNLRDLQGKAALEDLLNRVDEANKKQDRKLPIFLKIAPDLNETEIQDIADIALNVGLSAIICTNTTVDRKNLFSQHKRQSGGLSGRPLFERSTRILAQMRSATKGQIDLIGVGGISTAEDVYTKIQAGASAVQLYTALVYEGLSLVPKIADGLDKILVAEGIERLDKAVGVSTEKWL